MTEQEAIILLELKQHDNIQQVFEERLFDAKQYFLTRPVIPKVYRSKLSKLKLLSQAVRAIGIGQDSTEFESEQEFKYHPEIIPCFLEYERLKNILRLRISASENVEQIINLIELLLKAFLNYASQWPGIYEEIDGLLLSSEPDSVEFLRKLRMIESEGIITFDDLKKNISEVNQDIRSESKRLRMLYEKES